ncbi:MAG: hypothetical protein ACTSP4_09795 [Candidatus Hodarchaeales archaeon]
MAEEEPQGTDKVILRGYPETIYFWPSAIIGLIIGIFGDILTTSLPDIFSPGILATIFMIVFLFNFIIVTFDFSLGRTVIIFLILIVFVLVWMIISPNIFTDQSDPVQQIIRLSLPDTLAAGSAFYIIISGGIALMLVIVFISSRFSYWEIRSTEIYHHHGFFADTKRYPAQGAKILKETPDIFERILFRAANIIIIPAETKEVITVNNVWNASGKEKKIREVLSYVPDKA